jgi:multidrug efflux pump subunit AcrA (membrane-fusion protein)
VAQTTDQIVTASTGTIAQTVSAQGTAKSAQTDNLSFTSAGTVTAVNVKSGQHVSAGDVLAEIDSSALSANVSDAKATLAQAEARLSDDEAANASTTQITADNSSVTTAQDKVTSAQKALDGAKLMATFTGTVSQVNIAVGDQLGSGGSGGTTTTGSASGSGQSSSSLGSGSSQSALGGTGSSSSSSSTPQIQVVTPTSFLVDLGVDGSDISKLAVGQPATISLSTSTSSSNSGGFPFPLPGGGAFPGGGSAGGGNNSNGAGTTVSNVASAKGTVTEIGIVADASSGVAKYPVKIAFTDSSGGYNPGATVDVKITYAQKQNAVEVPTFAISTQNGASTVTVSKNGAKETRTVTTGLTSGNMTEITSGLSAGEKVVLTLPNIPGLTGRGATGTSGGQGGPGASGGQPNAGAGGTG